MTWDFGHCEGPTPNARMPTTLPSSLCFHFPLCLGLSVLPGSFLQGYLGLCISLAFFPFLSYSRQRPQPSLSLFSPLPGHLDPPGPAFGTGARVRWPHAAAQRKAENGVGSTTSAVLGSLGGRELAGRQGGCLGRPPALKKQEGRAGAGSLRDSRGGCEPGRRQWGPADSPRPWGPATWEDSRGGERPGATGKMRALSVKRLYLN